MSEQTRGDAPAATGGAHSSTAWEKEGRQQTPGTRSEAGTDPAANDRASVDKTDPSGAPSRAPDGTGSDGSSRGDDQAEDRVPFGRATPRPGPEMAKGTDPQVTHEPKPHFPPQHQGKPGFEAEMNPRPRYLAPLYKPAGKLAGKVALITGGDSGIGRAVAVIYAREGADVAIVFLPSELTDAEETQRAVDDAGRRCLLIPGDLTEERFCAEAVERTVKEFGHLDILVSNAAWQDRTPSVADISSDQWDTTFRTNIYAYFYLVRAALPHLKPGSAIIATSSVNGLIGNKQLPDYSATKGAINAFTKSLAQQLVSKGIRVNAVAPGPVWTPLNTSDQGQPADKVAKFGEDSPMGRPAQPEELAPGYVFLASDADSSFVTGIVLNEMGGETTAG